MAGTPADLQGAEDIKNTWMDQGLDSARVVPYKVYLQHPPTPDDEERANKVGSGVVQSLSLHWLQ